MNLKNYNPLCSITTPEEVVKEGFDLRKMASNLLLKVEELSQYLLEQNKKIEELQTKISELENK